MRLETSEPDSLSPLSKLQQSSIIFSAPSSDKAHREQGAAFNMSAQTMALILTTMPSDRCYAVIPLPLNQALLTRVTREELQKEASAFCQQLPGHASYGPKRLYPSGVNVSLTMLLPHPTTDRTLRTRATPRHIG